MELYKTKILIISPFFGKPNLLYRIWVKTLVGNPSISFLLPVDSEETLSFISSLNAPNIKSFYMSIKDFQALAETTLKTKCLIQTGRKLADFRPAFGLMFAQYVKRYDYWGVCDSDVVFGNLREVFTDKWAASFDKYNVYAHLMIFRNTDENNHLFMSKNLLKNATWKDALACPYNCYIEEFPISRVFDLSGKKTDIDFNDYADIHVYHYRFRTSEKTSFGSTPFILLWDNGHLFVLSKAKKSLEKHEIIYAHFQKRKMGVDSNAFSSPKMLIFPNNIVPVEKTDFLSLLPFFAKIKPFYGLKIKRPS